MADTQISPVGVVSAPSDWVVPNALTLTLGALFAHFDGSGAAGDFVPTAQIISDSGATVVEIPMDSTVAAGSSVEATWAPFLRTFAQGGAGRQLAYAEFAGNVTITGSSFATATQIIALPSVTLDGATDVLVELYSGVVSIPNAGLNVFVFDNGASARYISRREPSADGIVGNIAGQSEMRASAMLRGTDRPASGAHVYTLLGHKDAPNQPSPTIGGDTRADGNFLPLWARVLAVA